MLRIVPHTVPRVGRSFEHFPDGFELHLLPAFCTGGSDALKVCKVLHADLPADPFYGRAKAREFFIDNLMVRIHFYRQDDLVDRPCAMGVLNSLFHVALHLPSLEGRSVRLCWAHSKPV